MTKSNVSKSLVIYKSGTLRSNQLRTIHWRAPNLPTRSSIMRLLPIVCFLIIQNVLISCGNSVNVTRSKPMKADRVKSPLALGETNADNSSPKMNVTGQNKSSLSVDRLINLVTRSRLEKCLKRVICELGADLQAMGTSGITFVKALT